jgi:acetyltransferase-like isoleucine patch superfamily enzyme
MLGIGPRCLLKQFAQIMCYPGRKIEVGAESSIKPFCVLFGHGALSIGCKVRIAAHSVIIPANHKFDRLDTAITDQGLDRHVIKIEDDVWIGANCTICDGVTVGAGSIIGAGSVVTRTILPMSVAVVTPAREIKKRASAGNVLHS